jgi:predicted 2-oxoglutarate/Fe(II)-dependent dioxygenase YbiX
MPRSNFFVHLGLLAVKGFLDADLCARLRSEMELQSGFPAMIGATGNERVDQDVRRANLVNVSTQTKLLIKERLLDIQPRLESHFKITLEEFEKPQFLTYREGCFYTPHQDDNDQPAADESMKMRKVSAVIFLNGESEEARPGFYVGGKLKFYGLMKDPLWKNCGLPLIGEEGLLIAFRSDVMHEVTLVTCGARYTIVTWYY